MNRLFFKGHIPLIVSVCLATIPLPTLRAEPHCPGNVASLPLHLVNRHLFIVAVSINHSGPYNFLLDSGAQITMIDPSLAAELHLATQSGAKSPAPGLFNLLPSPNSTWSKPAPTLLPSKRCSFMTSRISSPPICTFGAFWARISSSTSTC